MRILQVAPRYAPAWTFGGGVKMAHELGREWTQRGHQVSVFTSDQLNASQRCEHREEVLDGIHVRRFPNLSPMLAGRFPFLFLRPRGLLTALHTLDGRVDVVHVTEARGPHNRWVAKAAHAEGVPIVWSAYGGLASGLGARRVYRALHDRVFDTREIVRKAAALVATTSHEADVYASFGADRNRIKQISLAVNWSEFEQLPVRGAFRAELGISDAQRLIVFLGRIHEAKGLQVLIPAFAQAARRLNDVHLAIVGWDYGFGATARRIVEEHGLASRVSFFDGRPGRARLQVYRDADLFVITPGIYEETTLTSLEACACGTACVITHQCEIPGLDAAGAGSTVDYEPGAVARAILAVLEANAERRMGALARELAKTSFSTHVVAARHITLFDDVRAEAAGR